MLKTLRTKWLALKEKNASASEMAEFYSEAVTTIRDNYIPDFVIKEYDQIKEILSMERTEECMFRSVDLPYKEMSEYEIGVNQYVQTMLEKAGGEDYNEDEWFTDVTKVKTNSLSFVESLFGDDVNPCQQTTVTEAMSCVESLMDLQSQCDAMLEAGQTMQQILEQCEDESQRDELANLYYRTETVFLLEYVVQCEKTYNEIKQALSGMQQSEGVQLL